MQHYFEKPSVYNPDIELVATSFCPYYLYREFSKTIVIFVNIPPAADADIIKTLDLLYVNVKEAYSYIL